MTTEAVRPRHPRRQRWYSILYIQVLIAIALGILIGYFYPNLGKALKPLGDGFIALIKMMIAPVIFCTVGARHLLDGRSEARRSRRLEDACLFRGRLDAGARHRPDRWRYPATGSRLQYRSGLDRPRRRSAPTSPRQRKPASSRHLMAIIPDKLFRRAPRRRRRPVAGFCWSRSFPVSLSPISARSASRSPKRSTAPPRCSSAFIRIIVRVAPARCLSARWAFTVGAYGLESLWKSDRADRDVLSDPACCFVLIVLGTIRAVRRASRSSASLPTSRTNC